MPAGHILVVDHEDEVRRLLEKRLGERGYDVSTAATTKECLASALARRPDLVILEAEAPDIDGIGIIQELRKGLLCPIIITGSGSDDNEIVLGLTAGADAYLARPVRIPVLLAYANAAIRRETLYAARTPGREPLKIRDLIVDPGAYEVRRDGELIPLTATEFKLLDTLARNAGRVLTRDQLLDQVWELRSEQVYSRTVDVHVGRIRRKLEYDPARPSYIVTVTGLGYKMPSG